MTHKTKKLLSLLASLFLLFLIFLSIAGKANQYLLETYKQRESVIVYDRNDEIISINPNQDGYYSAYIESTPKEFEDFLLLKEDKYFYSHFGVNPVSTLGAVINYMRGSENIASSTLTQQLVKILLGNEQDRNLKNKLIEVYYSISLELFNTKAQILKMYINSIYLGNQIQGLNLASKFYFETTPTLMTEIENIQLVSTISSPSVSHPFNKANSSQSNRFAQLFDLDNLEFKTPTIREIKNKRKAFQSYISSDIKFELDSLSMNYSANNKLSIDKNINKKIREIVDSKIQELKEVDANNSAVVVIKYPENELLAMIGSPNPTIEEHGYQINMAIKNRPIGSTIKPFIYVKGFEEGLRPYSLVDDREYKYIIDSGYAFYPKNYDYKYRGIVSLHYALSNSLNVPTVKVLEYLGLNNFYDFLLDDLEINPVQDLRNYQLGIALGQLEMDLLSLSYYFNIFTNNGSLTPLSFGENIKSPILDNYNISKSITDNHYIQLINKILSDRKTGVEQFGLVSEFNTFQENIALKTGTSRDYHDSWIVGYTPDFLVAVWVGNSENTPMKNVSGQGGAGRIWHDIMNLMLNSEYNNKTPFDFDFITEFDNRNIEYGLENDNYNKHKNILLEDVLILNPHDGDTFLLEENTEISLKTSKEVQWYINGKLLSEGKDAIFSPKEIGVFKIKATDNKTEEIINIILENNH